MAYLIFLTQPHILININGSWATGGRKEAEGGGYPIQRDLLIRDRGDKLSQFHHLLLLSRYPFAQVPSWHPTPPANAVPVAHRIDAR